MEYILINNNIIFKIKNNYLSLIKFMIRPYIIIIFILHKEE